MKANNQKEVPGKNPLYRDNPQLTWLPAHPHGHSLAVQRSVRCGLARCPTAHWLKVRATPTGDGVFVYLG